MQSLLNCLDEEAYGGESKFSFDLGVVGDLRRGFHGQSDYTLPKADRTEKYATTALLGHRITVWEEKGPS